MTQRQCYEIMPNKKQLVEDMSIRFQQISLNDVADSEFCKRVRGLGMNYLVVYTNPKGQRERHSTHSKLQYAIKTVNAIIQDYNFCKWDGRLPNPNPLISTIPFE